jgi:hypothetical protein
MPLFLTVAFGYFLKKKGVYDQKTLKQMNNLVFKFLLPLLLFNNVYKTKLETAFNLKLMGYCIIAILTLVAVSWVLIPRIEKDNKKRGVIIQGIFRSNFVILGLPIAASLYSENEIGAVALSIAVIVPTFNVLAVIVLEVFRGERPDLKKISKGIATNPLMIGSVLGLIALYLGIKLPTFLEKTISDISKIGSPLAIILLGGSFEFEAVGKHLKSTLLVVISKLFLVPLLILPVFIYLGFRNVELLTVFLIFGTPTAVSSYTMAEQMGGDGELAGQIVIFTSLICIVSIFISIFILKELAFI